MIRCPVCGSRDIYRPVGGVLGEMYRCKKCGYSGALVIETVEEPDDKSRD